MLRGCFAHLRIRGEMDISVGDVDRRTEKHLSGLRLSPLRAGYDFINQHDGDLMSFGTDRANTRAEQFSDCHCPDAGQKLALAKIGINSLYIV